MAKNLGLNLGVVALLALAATGCGKTSLTAMVPAGTHAAAVPTVMAAGVERKLGYNYKRYETVGAKKAHPQHMVRQGILRGAVDNRQYCSPVADQGKLGSCTGFAMGKGLREYILKENGQAQTPLSALFLYYEERVIEGSVDEDSGAMMSDGMQVLTDTGIATEASWAYDITKFAIKPPAAAYAEAPTYKIHDAKQLETLDDVKTAINAGQAVTFGFRVYDSFRKIGADGMMPVPKPNERLLGGHAVLAVGYDDAKKVLIVRNSWSEKWGDKGYFYMPYEVAKSSQVHEYWTASK